MMLLNAEMSSITSAQQWLTNTLYTELCYSATINMTLSPGWQNLFCCKYVSDQLADIYICIAL